MQPQSPKPTFKHRLLLMVMPLATFLVRLMLMTLKVELIDPHGLAPQAKPKSPLIYAFWHNQQLLAAYYFRNHGIRVLVSRSKDGDYIAAVLHQFGFGTVRSSSSQGKVNALRGLARALHQGHHAAITPDGPRGPLYQAQPGAVFLAALSGHTLAPFGCAVEKVWRLRRSWDQFEIPKPFSRAVIVYGEPMTVPKKLDASQSKMYQERLQTGLTQLRQQALDQLAVRKSKQG